MKITLAMVSSVNGKITKGNNPYTYTWTSAEDRRYFTKLIKNHSLIVMGSKTYEAARSVIKHENKKLRIVMTRNIKKYEKENMADRLEFTDKSPRALVRKFSQRGYVKMLVVGGAQINASFLKAKLIDELSLTLEPQIFGRGKSMVEENNFYTPLLLKSVKKLNISGTLLLHYKCKK